MHLTLTTLMVGSVQSGYRSIIIVSLMVVLSDPIVAMTNHLEILKQDSVYLTGL